MLGLVVVTLLSFLVSCVACDLHRPSHVEVDLTTELPDFVNGGYPPANKTPIPPVKPVINITAVFEEQDLDDFIPIFERALADLINESVIYTWSGHVLSATRDLRSVLTGTCAHFEGDRSQVRLIVVFGRVRTVQTVNLISEALGIPVIGYMVDKGDGYVQVHNPLFLSLQPSHKHLAKGLVSLLEINFWFRLTIITQEELRHDGFYRTFRELTSDSKWTIEDEVFISKRASMAVLNASLEAFSRKSSRIFILHATATFTRHIFLAAKRVLPKGNRFAWIITENAYTQSESMLRDFPFGTKAFLVNHDMVPEELLRDVLDFTSDAFQGDGKLGLIFRLTSTQPSSSLFSLVSLSSSLSSLYSKSSSRKNKAYGCWSAMSETVHPFQDPVYNALLTTTTYGLSGQLAFDEDGYMDVSKFRVRNLVFDGRQSVWQDIGCVQGKEVRPFGIIWPGDAQNLKADTEGKKRYKVVTNPVQPFVMTEAPHSDYRQCLSDTPCLNLTSKFKSQEIVWLAIEAYERGDGYESGLFTIQCCRGLTIDLLNKLSADLEFEFTLYIVQDETYGQRSPNGTWTGMMRDLTDNTAHFAVAAFSITSKRDSVIDFTDPYFFSGFSIIYSDRTRETSMMAFLEPFSTEVWFAILVSAQIAAVCMALLEWNSPFGLNPWGRKRTKNYSLASGITMVFSVLFGHTVRTKSPKAWPSKFFQNIWAFGAIFIISSYTANLAAFIAGKHAGINYIDIQDPRLQDIRLGVLPDSAVHGVLKNGGSKLAHVAERFPVPKTDVGIDWVIKGKLDALLGDYSILDYARAHLAPSCELKLISKLFGEDRYGLGLPKDSPLKTLMSLTYFHSPAGLFVMLCIGIVIGVLVLLLEHGIYKFLVPYIRKCPETSRWRSIHLMFVSQRLQRIITSPELVSPHHSAKELLKIFKTREFARLFQKSTIRRNRMADMAKTKRINRNFYDIVQKAKWLKEMQDSGLTDDEGQPTSTIIEIPLKKLTVNVELGSTTLTADREMESLILSNKSNTCVANSAPVTSSDEASSPESDDSLLGRNGDDADKRLPDIYRTSPVLPAQLLMSSLSTSSHLQEMSPSDHHYRCHHSGYDSSPTLDAISTNDDHLDACSDFNYDECEQSRRASTDRSNMPVLSLNSPPNNTRQRLSSGSSLPSAFVVNELSSLYRPEHQSPSTVANSTTGRVKLSGCLQNTLPKRLPALDCEDFHNNEEIANRDEENGRHELCDEALTVINDNPHMHPFSDDSYNPAGIGASASNYINKALLPKTNNVSLAQSFLHKTQTHQDHMCSAAESAQAEASQEPFCLDTVTKEELLVLWKSSEIELHKRLKAALKEKSRLERKLEMLQIHSLV